MNNLLIIGARGYGRETYNMAVESIGYGETFVIKGYLDDKFDALDGFEGYPPIIDSVENYEIQKDDVFVCALGDVHYKKKYVDAILSKGGHFINLVHKDAYISRNVSMGQGCIICRQAGVSCDISIGDFVTLQSMVSLGHDVVIGNFCHLNSCALLGGGVVLGDLVTIHPSAVIHPHKKIGNNVIVGAGSVVIRNIKDNVTVIGNPATVLKY